MGSLWSYVVVDALDPARLARWWAEVLDLRILEESPDDVTIGVDAGTFPQLYFIRVTEPKTGKNRLHLDLRGEDQTAEVERLVDMGARHVDIGQGGDVKWVVLGDPEGNEFCVLAGRRPDRPQ